MKCIDPKMRKLVGLYQLDLLTAAEKLSVEAHLLECDYCFEEIYRLSPAIEIIEEMPEFFLDALKPRETGLIPISRAFKESMQMLTNRVTNIFSQISEWWKRPVIKILVPVTAIAILLLILFPVAFKNYSDLAIIENASYIALKARGFVEEQFSPTQNLFDHGMKLYQEKNYKEAIHKLNAFVKRNKKDAYGHFYLGVSLLLTDEINKGISQLKFASELSQEQGKEILLEKCYWYLGNGYLKINDAENALAEFKKVLDIGGEFGPEAKKQIQRIEEMKEKSKN